MPFKTPSILKSSVYRTFIRIVFCFIVGNTINTVEAGNFSFRKYQVNHGLSENTIHAILQDHQGFMWFGTKDGLNRFDGREFKIFKHNPVSEGSIGNNFIRDLFQHKDSTIWIGTDNGLYIYDPKDDIFNSFKAATKDSILISAAVNSICYDGKNYMWIGTMTQGLFRYDLNTKQLVQYTSSDDRNSLKSDLVWRVYKDMSGIIWVGTRNGLSRYNSETESFYTYNKTNHPGELSNAEVLAIFEDSDGELWVGTWSGGLSRLNRSNNTFKTWFDADQPVHISHIRVIFGYDRHQLMIGSDDGLYLFNKSTEDFTRIDNPRDPNSLSDQNVYTIVKDLEGGLWIGTYFGGVNYYSSVSKYIDHFYPSFAPHSMSGKAVSQFCEDTSGNLWIATEDGGLNYFDKTTRRFKVMLPGNPGNSLSYHNIHSLLLDGNNLWIGTFSRGLDVYNIKTQTFRNYRHNPNDINSIDDDCIFSLYKNQQGEIMVGTPYGLSIYDPSKDNFIRIPEVRSFVYKIKEDYQGNLWVASYGNGIYKYNPVDEKWSNFVHNPSNPNSIGYNKVIEIYSDNQHRLWFGTEGRGLYRYNYETNDFYCIDQNKGLPNNTIYGILDDKFGNIWVSTNKGLAKINPENLQIKTYTQSDGLQSDQFNYRSSYKSSDGLFYFGGINGFNVFNPDDLKINEYIPAVVITKIELLDVEATSDSDIFKSFRENKKIILKHDQASIRISFVSLSYMAPEKNRYAFTMDNYNNQWISTSDISEASYINLPQGKYTFRVRGSNNDGIWNESGDYINIEVLPPFYKTVYAYIFYYLFLIVILLLSSMYYYKLLKERQRKKLELFQKEKEKEVYNSKINFFTSIAHEIRTPVSLIKAPLECIINANEGNKETRENLKVIERNTERLIQLINQLLDFRKIDENLYKLNFSKVNINQVITDVCYRFKPTAEKSHINFITDIPGTPLIASLDKEAFTKIVSNILSNAVKYTHSYISISLSVDLTKNSVVIRVTDNGEGIKPELREKVFEPFYQIEPTRLSDRKPGTGIGLALTRQLVERQKGTIGIETPESGQGSVFIVRFPLLTGEGVSDETNDLSNDSHDCIECSDEDHSSRLHLLVVEDNKDMLEFMKKNLRHDFTVYTAENGKEALDILSKKHADIIVSDVMMPVMDGVELVEQIKQHEQYCHIPVVLLSARTNIEIKIEGLESGADCYIEKPFSIEFLKAQINSLIKNRLVIQEKFANSPFISIGSIASNKKDEEFLSKLNKEIDDNLTDADYSIEKLSQSLSMSRSNLQRKIKGLTGMPPNDYIRVYRLKKAAVLLQTSGYRINEICYLVGFNSPSYFSKCFHKQFGVLPKEFIHVN